MKATFKLYTYDLWSDGEGGLTVNDVYPQREFELNLKRKVANPGTPQEFTYFDITDRQINRAIGARGLTWDGEIEYTLHATDRKGNPACELRRVS
jgi:hypothetical protein